MRQTENNQCEASAKIAWDSILRVTEAAGDELKSLRVLLYFTLTDNRIENLKGRLRFLRKIARWYFVRSRKIPESPKGLPLFAFIFDTPANMNNLLPVFQCAIRRSLKPAVLCGENVDFQDAGQTQNRIGIRELMAATTLKERVTALARAKRLHGVLCAHFADIAPQFVTSVRQRGAWITSELAIFLAVRHGLRRLYSAWEPSCVVSTSDLWPFDHGVFAEASRQRIPSFVVQHGVTNRYWWPCVADKLLLWGSAFEKELGELGAPASRLVCCGMPASDGLFTRFNHKNQDFVPKPVKSCVILSDSQSCISHPSLYSKYKSLLKTVVRVFPSIKWMVKLHPIENDVFYQDFAGSPNFEVLPKTTTLEQAVTHADAACTLWSTSGLEAMIMRRPLFVLDVEPLVREFAWWPNSGGGLFAGTADAMIDLLGKATADSTFVSELVTRQDEFLKQSFSNPGRAAEAVVDSIEEIISGKSASAVQQKDILVPQTAFGL